MVFQKKKRIRERFAVRACIEEIHALFYREKMPKYLAAGRIQAEIPQFPVATMQRAKHALGIKSRQFYEEGKRQWYWLKPTRSIPGAFNRLSDSKEKEPDMYQKRMKEEGYGRYDLRPDSVIEEAKKKRILLGPQHWLTTELAEYMKENHYEVLAKTALSAFKGRTSSRTLFLVRNALGIRTLQLSNLRGRTEWTWTWVGPEVRDHLGTLLKSGEPVPFDVLLTSFEKKGWSQLLLRHALRMYGGVSTLIENRQHFFSEYFSHMKEEASQ